LIDRAKADRENSFLKCLLGFHPEKVLSVTMEKCMQNYELENKGNLRQEMGWFFREVLLFDFP